MKKHLYIEYLRILACLFVIYDHTCEIIIHFTSDDYTKSRIVTLILLIICKTAVPLFIMISGGLLLHKEDTPKEYRHRLFTALNYIVLATGFYYAFYAFKHGYDLSLAGFGSSLLHEVASFLWYIYLYLGIILALPFLRRISLTRNLYIYLIAIYLLGPGLIPLLQEYLNFPDVSKYLFQFMPGCYMMILFIGDFVMNHVDVTRNRKKIIVSSLVGIVLSISFSYGFLVHELFRTGKINYGMIDSKTYFTPTIILACCIFLLFKTLMYDSQKFKKMIVIFGKATLPIYLTGDFLIHVFTFVYDYLKVRMSELLAVLIFDIVLFVAGLLLASWYYLLKEDIKTLREKKKTKIQKGD